MWEFVMSNIIILTLQIQELLLIASIRMQFSINVKDKSGSLCFTRNSWKACLHNTQNDNEQIATGIIYT